VPMEEEEEEEEEEVNYLHCYVLWWRQRHGYIHRHWCLSVHPDILIVQEYYGILPFYFPSDSHCSQYPTYAVHNRIYNINTSHHTAVCKYVCTFVCVYVRVSVTHARVMTRRGLRMLAEHRSTQVMSRDVNTLWQRILPRRQC
jgi:hypothetical protein